MKYRIEWNEVVSGGNDERQGKRSDRREGNDTENMEISRRQKSVWKWKVIKMSTINSG